MVEAWRVRNLPFSYMLTVVVVILFSFAAAYLEYNYILFDGLPYREAVQPVLGSWYNYHLVFFLPILAWLAFQPFINQVIQKVRSSENFRRTSALGLASVFLGVILEDVGWFLLRFLAPLRSDPLAHQWIRGSDYTSSVIGYATIFGTAIPLWYFVLLTPAVAIFIALIISPRV